MESQETGLGVFAAIRFLYGFGLRNIMDEMGLF